MSKPGRSFGGLEGRAIGLLVARKHPPFFAKAFWLDSQNMIGAEFHIATNVGSLSFGEKSIGDVARRVNCAIIRCC